MNFTKARSLLFAAFGFVFSLTAFAAPAGVITYNPTPKTIQGNQPLDQNYDLTITGPVTLTANVPVTINLVPSIISKEPAVSDNDALSFLIISPGTLTFTQPNESIIVNVRVKVGLGAFAGNYAYNILATGWPASANVVENLGATVNARVSPAGSTDTSRPSVIIQQPLAGTVYTYLPVSGSPVSVPVVFDATVGTNGQPITGMTATINDLPVNGTVTGEGTLSASFVGSTDLTEPGTYVVKVNATNLNGTSEDQADISVVVSAPPPTITVSTPTAGATYTYVNNTPGASVSVSYTAVSEYGNITSTGVSLDGLPLSLNLNGVGTSTTATGSTNLVLTQGDYVLEFNAANAFGIATPVAVPIKVRSMEPTPVIPTVSILSPSGDAVFERTEGDPATVVNYTFTGNTTSGVIESVTVTLDGATVSPSVSGLTTADVTGTGSASYSAPGTHTLSVTVSNGQATATALTNFTVNESPLQVCQNLTWLPPISLNKTVEGGSTVPIKFRLDCQGQFVEDHSTIITIYEIYADGTFSAPVVYPYGTGSPNPPDYAITGQMYHLNFATAKGTHRYRIEVYHPLNAEGTSLQLLGAKELLTQGKGKSSKSEKADKSSKSKKDDKSIKSSKDHKDHKDDKSVKGSKSGKDQKSAKNAKGNRSSKNSKR